VTRIRLWLVVIAAAGLVSSALAASLFWFVVTHPLRAAQWLGGGL
jgi:hypothetical protein